MSHDYPYGLVAPSHNGCGAGVLPKILGLAILGKKATRSNNYSGLQSRLKITYHSLMHLEEDQSQGDYLIKRYDAHSVTVNETIHRNSLIIGLNCLIPDWQPRRLSALSLADLQPIFDLKPQVVILGTGTRFELPSKEIISAFHSRHIGFEFMDTPAACRTFVVLAAEGRQVVAALLLDPK